MQEIQEKVRQHLVDNYNAILGEAPVEKFPGTYFPHILAEFIQRDERTLQVSCHIGVEVENEDKIMDIKSRLESSLGQLSIEGHLWHYGGMSPSQHVAVNEQENLFIQQPVHFVITQGEIENPQKHIL